MGTEIANHARRMRFVDAASCRIGRRCCPRATATISEPLQDDLSGRLARAIALLGYRLSGRRLPIVIRCVASCNGAGAICGGAAEIGLRCPVSGIGRSPRRTAADHDASIFAERPAGHASRSARLADPVAVARFAPPLPTRSPARQRQSAWRASVWPRRPEPGPGRGTGERMLCPVRFQVAPRLTVPDGRREFQNPRPRGPPRRATSAFSPTLTCFGPMIEFRRLL